MERGNQKNEARVLCLQEGRTLIELLISLSLSLLLLTVAIQSQVAIKKNVEKLKIHQLLQAEAATFIHYLEREMACTKQVLVLRGEISFYCQSDRLDYKQEGTSIIRRIRGDGHVTVCYYVQSFRAVSRSNGVQIYLTLEKDQIQMEVETLIPYYITMKEWRRT